LFHNFSFFSENRSFYEIIWKNVVETGRPQMAIRGFPGKYQAILNISRTGRVALL